MAYPQAAVSAARVKEVLDFEFSIQDKENPTALENITGRIEFKDVSFGYTGAEIPVLELEPCRRARKNHSDRRGHRLRKTTWSI